MKARSNQPLVLGLVLLLSVTLLLAGRFWDSKPYQEWSQREALSLLRDSAWSGTQVVRMPIEVQAGSAPPPTRAEGSSGVAVSRPAGSGTYGGTTGSLTRTTAAFSVSLVSAKPVRMALARLGMLNGTMDAAGAEQLVENSPFGDRIAVSLAVESSTEMIDLEALTTAELQDSSYLELKKSKRRITLAQYVPPSKSGNGWPLFVFPRSEDGRALVTPAEKQVKFVTRLSKDLTVEQKFKLGKMLFNGQLEL